ncbi:MAG: hypothetical protein LIO75_00620 [Lachnospiraceae bacterium]|nr:hypothetical protein [Lachnospiraceae bacterium]
MYHMKNDLRVTKSAEQLYVGLSRCMQQKKIEDITSWELQEASGVGRTTYFRLFDSKYDILQWKCDQHVYRLFSAYAKDCPADTGGFSAGGRFFRYFFDYWRDDSLIIEQAIDTGRVDIVYEACRKSGEKVFRQRKPSGEDEIGDAAWEQDYALCLQNGMLVSVLTTWVRRGKKERPEELRKFIGRMLAYAGYGAL